MSIPALEPKAVWTNFLSICGIPRGSGNEAAIADWLLLRARSLGLEASQDAVGNVIIRKPASRDREFRNGVVLQAHMDMVCQAANGVDHDFKRDPIRPQILADDPDWMLARGTTLGADNGIGMAAILAVLEATDLVHGPLEALFTVNEENGMSGARGLKPDSLKGNYVLNLDSEAIDELTIGCAGSLRANARLELPALPAGPGLAWIELAINGLQGGHSGVDIAKQRANASRLLARMLTGLPVEIRLASLVGGNALNAIPRQAEALLCVPAASLMAVQAAVVGLADEVRRELAVVEPQFSCGLAPGRAAAACLSPADSQRALRLLLELPNGLQSMDAKLPNTIRTSLNLGITSLAPSSSGQFELSLGLLVRSSDEAEKLALAATIEAACQAAGGRLERLSVSPAWQPEWDSPLLKTACAVFKQVHGAEANLTVTHGGLECGLFRPLYPRWQMVSLGPNLRFAHSPDEALHIPSVAEFWRYLVALLRELQ
ncbi:MAG: hypothetical protein A2087_11035 [Spirochaetes bacterium GWD1_61_31]|nr:MAG: hypothetical protein A2Y37_10015 [Spirochaetes bacterium GWB1_60_80]OHD29083.1 MAG: hypothetical protein A2004_14635 [Spirochaetes bacterium GWC1_61_12]OHD43114.1 MAG: hypothetical protein A2087_11035 [Spirochaetes bacterium GWD1_61_31]OHD44248.1 MAG: hypothetical protein A2Y35_06830 [Spirochaetes bacterium GWE1_60_18]OHD60392.1 MAG: hypothetical protein A2Y32_00695 [Spirochaetes bacterium GWF1_60_12]